MQKSYHINHDLSGLRKYAEKPKPKARHHLTDEEMRQKYKTARYIIGIDAGTETGLSLYDRKEKRLVEVMTTWIHRAMDYVLACQEHTLGDIFVRVEDARESTYHAPRGKVKDEKKERARLQGAGSVKRDASIWEDFLTDNCIPFQLVNPMHNTTKLDKDPFFRITGWQGSTDSHGRDAAMLCFKI